MCSSIAVALIVSVAFLATPKPKRIQTRGILTARPIFCAKKLLVSRIPFGFYRGQDSQWLSKSRTLVEKVPRVLKLSGSIRLSKKADISLSTKNAYDRFLHRMLCLALIICNDFCTQLISIYGRLNVARFRIPFSRYFCSIGYNKPQTESWRAIADIYVATAHVEGNRSAKGSATFYDRRAV